MAGTHPKPVDRAVDAWIRRELAVHHSAVLEEPVPADLIRLAGQVSARMLRHG